MFEHGSRAVALNAKQLRDWTVMNHKRTQKNVRRASYLSIAAAISAVLLGATVPNASVAYSPEQDFPLVADEELNITELDMIAEQQTSEQIAEVISMASPDQWVQIYVDGDTFEYLAAVLLEDAPKVEVPDALSTVGAEAGTAPIGKGTRAVTGCSATGGPKATSSHLMPDRTMGWCGSGAWSGTIGGAWYRFANFTGYWAYAGTSSQNFVAIPAYTAVTLNPAPTLKYVQLS